jgi:hypothetical protein
MDNKCVLAGVFFLFAVSTFGQERSGLTESRVDISLGSAVMHVGPLPALNASGLDLGSQYHLTSWLGYSGQAWFAVGSGTTIQNYLVGPEFILRRKVSPFAHVLIGIAHFSQKGRTDTSFGTAVGGGVIYDAESHISWRAIEVDYAPTYFRGGRQDNIRLSTGFVIRF